MKRLDLAAILLTAFLTVSATLTAEVRQYDKSEWKIRPWEIINGLQPYSQLVWHCDKGDLAQWKASNSAVLSETDLTKLWGEKVAKLTFPKGGSVTITPPAPLEIKERFDGIEFYMYGPLNGPVGALPTTALEVLDAKGKKHLIKLAGAGSRWAETRWWSSVAGFFPAQLEFPIRINAIRLGKLTTRFKDDFLCFDRIGVFNLEKIDLKDSTEAAKGIFPVTEDGIMPIGMREGAKNSVRANNNSYVFSYHGSDAEIAYTYVPQTGTLSDITVSINGKTFKPAVNGGIHALVNKVKFTPGDEKIQAKLVRRSLKNNRLATVWQWKKDNAEYKFELNFSIKGKSLAVEAKSLSEGGRFFDCGKTENTVNPRLFHLTYLHNRWNYPRFMVTDDYFVSVFLDWYYSNSSELLEGSSRGGIDGARVYEGKNSAKIMGGSVYNPLTDRSYNDIYEKMYITVSPELDDVMPHINNPVSRMLKASGEVIYSTRMYPVHGDPVHADEEIAFWNKMRDYGAGDIFVRFHMGLQRTPVENNNLCMHLEGAHQNGGDKMLRHLSEDLRKAVKYVGLYSNNREIHPFAGRNFFNYNSVMLESDGSIMTGWDGIYRPKSGNQVQIHAFHSRELLKKFPALNAQYLDELTNAPPWSDTDYDAKVPGAGKFAATMRDYALVAWAQTLHYNGPIWSEGCAAYFWAGVMDVNYACSNDSKAGLPLIVDFKLKRMNKLSNFTGSDWPIVGQSAQNMDYLIANQIACGNVGHLGNSGDSTLPWQGRSVYMKNFAPTLKSYYMMRQVQEYFVGQIPVEVKYDIDGKLMTASEMLKGNHNPSGKIHAVYPSGLQTWVNHNAEGEWTVNVEGEDFTLPPYGHVAIVPDELLQYTAVIDGRTVDYSRGKHYTYMNGRGEMTEFPEMSCANAYLMRQVDGKTRITPAPFKVAETIKGLSFNKATPLKQDGSKLADTFSLDVTDAGMGDLNVDGKAFHYTME